MAKTSKKTQTSPTSFNIVLVAQSGRLAYEALLFAASLRHSDPDFSGKLLICEPQPSGYWPQDPRLPDHIRDALIALDAEIIPFENNHFGHDYPNGNKIECLLALPEGEPFVFFDSFKSK